MKISSYNSSRCRDANQAMLPTALGSLFLATSWRNRSRSQIDGSYWQVLLTNFIGNLGLVILKIFNHSQSNKAAIKNPTATAEMVSNSQFSVKATNGTKIQQLANRIKRTLGKYLAYVSNCSVVISQSSGTLLGNCHNRSLRQCSLISQLAATIGYIKIKNGPAALDFLVNSIITVIIRLVISIFVSIANKPEHAITLGSLKKFLNLILTLKIDLFKITQNSLTVYFRNGYA